MNKLLTPLPTSGQVKALIYLRVSTARQATKNGEAEGYSIPAQREACRRKAVELGATVIDEYIDAGASARSADRRSLQAMLERVQAGDIAYVIVHKVDRLARSRIDDAQIATVFHLAGTTLVSVSEQIDNSPSGALLHGIMATIAEHYSNNLSYEAKKGMAEKVRRGGTNGVAPLGYLNVTKRVDGIEVRTIELDPDRASNVRWAYKQYATGNWSINALCEALDERGFRTRTTRKIVGKPLSRAQLHRMLTNPYYKGQLVFNGMIYPGGHEPLVSDVLWQEVQDVLSGRRIAGDRSWRHTHYLKGALKCGRCKGRIGFATSRGKGGSYEYFFCIDRHTGRSACDLPYLPVEEVEVEVARQWIAVRFSDEQIVEFSQRARNDLHRSTEAGSRLIADQRRRVADLERQQQKLMDAFLADAMSVQVLKARQIEVESQLADAHRLLASAQTSGEAVSARLEQVLDLLRHAEALYATVDDDARKLLNHAVFETFLVDRKQEDGQTTILARAPLTPLVEAVIAGPSDDGGPETAGTPGDLAVAGGSNLTHLAVAEGFEPSVGLHPQTLSRRSP
ncbi:hypothetical protein GCM10028771_07970 [Nocardioides marmoraquaticus]